MSSLIFSYNIEHRALKLSACDRQPECSVRFGIQISETVTKKFGPSPYFKTMISLVRLSRTMVAKSNAAHISNNRKLKIEAAIVAAMPNSLNMVNASTAALAPTN